MSKENQNAVKNYRKIRLSAIRIRLEGYKSSLKAATNPNIIKSWQATIKRANKHITRWTGRA